MLSRHIEQHNQLGVRMGQSLLKNIYLFEHFTDTELAQVEKIVKKQTVEAGQDVFGQGAAAESLFVIAYGSIRISQEGNGGEMVIRPLATGSHFGEMALIDRQKRSATATAVERSELLEVPYDALESLFVDAPELAAKLYKSLAHYLSGRLRETTSQLGFARSQFRGA